MSAPKNLPAVMNSSDLKNEKSLPRFYISGSDWGLFQFGLSVKLPTWEPLWTLALYVHRTGGLPCERCGGSRGCLWLWWWVCTHPRALCPVVCSPAPHLSDRHREEEASHVCLEIYFWYIKYMLLHILHTYPCAPWFYYSVSVFIFLSLKDMQYLYTR